MADTARKTLVIAILIVIAALGWMMTKQEKATAPTAVVSPTAGATKIPALQRIGCARAGCSSELCVNWDKRNVESICIYKEEFKCLSYSRCEKQKDGNCGWTKTRGYLECMKVLNSR